MKKRIYLDHSATSWPKPPEVKKAVLKFMDKVGANPGRSGHLLSIEAARILYEAREVLATCLNMRDPLRIVFTLNATEALNLALRGLLKPGDHVITSSMEHNSVMRPLRSLVNQGIELTVVPCSPEGILDPTGLEREIRERTRMVVLNHASNVTGTLLPVQEVGSISRKHDLLFVVDAAQTAGVYPIDMERDRIDLLAFTGHKSLYGPQGTGGLVLGERVHAQGMVPLKEGGTGSRSEHEQQPEFLPDRFESGTPNGPGIAGLLAGVRFVLSHGIEQIRDQELRLTKILVEGLKAIRGVKLYGPANLRQRMATVSFNMTGISPSEGALRLEKRSGILCRPGLHCAPAAHRTIGTFPEGTIRFSLGFFNTEEEVRTALEAVEEVAASGS